LRATSLGCCDGRLAEPLLADAPAFRDTFQSSVIRWYGQFGRAYPWRQTRDPFEILVAEFLLRLTGAWKAEKVYEYIMAKYPTPGQMAKADKRDLLEQLRPLGLWGRADTLVEIATTISEHLDGYVPRTHSELVAIKGIGQYTANAILCLAYDERVPLVDGSVSRVFRRCLNFSTGKPAYADRQLWIFAEMLLPKRQHREYNLGLLDIGALVCKHARQLCNECPLASICLRNGVSLE